MSITRLAGNCRRFIYPVVLLSSLALAGCGGSGPESDKTPPMDDGNVLLVRVSQDVSLDVNVPATLSGEVMLDGLSAELASVQWEQLSGPGSTLFESPDSLQTVVTFDTQGVYVLRMSASLDGMSSADTLVATVSAAITNLAPLVDAGEDAAIMLGDVYTLAGNVSDDGLPGASLASLWSQLSGTGTATFGETSLATTTVSFSQSGSYVLQLLADDGELTSTDKLTISVQAEATVPGGDPANGSADWQRVNSSDGSQPQARHEAGGLALNNQFYLMGGRGNRQVNRYDPQTRRWENLGTPPRQMNHFQPVAWNNKIYVMSALDCCYPSERVLDRIQVFNPADQSWSQGVALPANRKRGSAGVVVYNNKIYLVGGSTNGHDGGAVDWFDEFDPATNSWKTLPDAPTRRDHFQAAVVGNRLVAAGGRQTDYPNTFGGLVGTVDVYNFDTGKWETNAPDLPVARAGTVAVSYGPEVIVLGGEGVSAGPASSRVDAYNVTTRTWRRLDDMIETRHGGGAAVLGDELHIASGSNNQGGAPETRGHEMLLLK